MSRTALAIIGGVVVVLGLAALFILRNPVSNPDAGDSTPATNNEAVVQAVVTELGTKLQNVSLLSPTPARKAAMDTHYAAYVAPELLQTWYPEGAEGALGRYSSSPWPIEIRIVETRVEGERYIVEGNVIEVARTSSGETAPAAAYPVTFELEKRGEEWLIVKAEKGAYSQISHEQSIVGYWECLPHKDTNGPHTLECAFGIAVDQSDGHYAIDTSLMARYPVDYPTGTKVRITGIVTPSNQLSSPQKYDIDGIIRATVIEEVK